ncbi:hypothetical protein SPFM12_00064 [Salmonella phage SPFM12]|nr:hypothetical protein SPFM12_00064 [Salmonella phage SPFM12]
MSLLAMAVDGLEPNEILDNTVEYWMFKDQEVKGGKYHLSPAELYKVIDEKWDWNALEITAALAYMQNNYHRLEITSFMRTTIRDMCDSNPRLRRKDEWGYKRSGANYTLDLLPGSQEMGLLYHLSLWHYLSDTLVFTQYRAKGGHTGVKFKMVLKYPTARSKAMNASVNDLKEIKSGELKQDQTYNAKTGVNEEFAGIPRRQLSFLTNSLLVATGRGGPKANGKLLDDAGDDLNFYMGFVAQLADDAGKAMAAGDALQKSNMMSRWPSAFARGGEEKHAKSEVGDSEQNILNAQILDPWLYSIDSLSEWHTSSLMAGKARETPFPDPIRRSAKKGEEYYSAYIRDEVEKRFKEYGVLDLIHEGRYNMVGSDIMALETGYISAAKANGLEVSPTGRYNAAWGSKYDTEVTAALSRGRGNTFKSTLLDFCIFMILQRGEDGLYYLNGGFAHIMGFAVIRPRFNVYTIMDHALGNYEKKR